MTGYWRGKLALSRLSGMRFVLQVAMRTAIFLSKRKQIQPLTIRDFYVAQQRF